MSSTLNHRPCGCDTFVAFPPATRQGVVVFGKNSDRPAGEGQTIRRYPRQNWKLQDAAGCSSTHNLVQCTYICIPQAATTNAVLLSQIDWMWGAEMGANEYGVVIGNEAVWTREPCRGEPKALLGMDLVRLGLERGNTAKEALNVIMTLLEEHGQGGPCAQDDPDFTYHNSFLIVDKNEAWVLETAGRHWVAERVTSGVRNISNCLSIRTHYDLSSQGIMEHAQTMQYRNANRGEESLDFTEAFCTGSAAQEIGDPRFCWGRTLLEHQAASEGGVNKDSMIAILRDHSQGICMHGDFETTSSWVSEIYLDSDNVARHWVTGKPHPCKNPFIEEMVGVPDSTEKAHP